jgi:hypothetical protein
VFVVGEDGTVAAKQVTPGPRVGNLRTIRAGLAPTDKVVIQGLQMIQPGAKVTERAGRIEAPRATVAQPAAAITEPAASQATLTR